jgi:ubiquitin C-terminal hydrolase
MLMQPVSVTLSPLQSADTPAGLRNLGNTCYVNAAMQFLHSLPDFRHALYVLEPHLAAQDVVQQMR